MNNTDLQHAGQLLTSLAKLQLDPDSCDVILQVEGTGMEVAGQAGGKPADDPRSVWGHRVVLAAASPYFFRIFERSFEKCSMQVLVIKGVKLETLRALVCNIYSPESLPETIEGMKELLLAAKLLEVEEVSDAACIALERAMTASNAFHIRIFAEQQACTGLAGAASQYIQHHFEYVLKADGLLTLAPDELAILLSTERIATMEQVVLEAVLKWTQHRPQERRQHLNSLLQAVRLRLVPREVLTQRAGAEPLVSEQRALIQVIEALTADHERPRPGHVTQQPASLLVMGGDMNESGTNTVLLCPLPGGRWQSVAPMFAPRTAAGAALLDGRVYLIGGREGSTPVRTVFMYDAATDTWLSGPTLTRARRWLGVAALSGRLYAVGGWNDDNTALSWILPYTTPYTAEALDPREGVWRPIASMSTRRRGLGVAVLNEKLYAVGGHDGRKPLNSTERYVPAADSWETVAAMSEPRDAVRVGVVNEEIYAVGGWDASSVMKSVERYHVGSGWETAPAMTVGRSSVAVTAHEDRLYAVGGYDGSVYTNYVSMFDSATAEWSELPALPEGRSVTATIVVPWSPNVL